jgi:hypothetical protein
MNKKNITLGYAMLSLMYIVLSFAPLVLVGPRNITEVVEFGRHLLPATTPLLAQAAVTAALAVSVWRVSCMGPGARKLMIGAACGMALLGAVAAGRALWALNAGQLPSYAQIMPFMAVGLAFVYAFQAVGVVRIAKGSNKCVNADCFFR